MATRAENGALGCGGRRELGCGSEAAGSQPREKTPGCCGLNCLVQPQKATLKKNARWLKRAVATRNKKRQKNARWLTRRVLRKNKEVAIIL